MLAFLEGHLRARRRELVGIEIIDLLPVETVGGHLLIEETRGDREILGRFPAERHAAAIAFAAVDVLALAAAFAQRIDEAAVARVVADRAHREILA